MRETKGNIPLTRPLNQEKGLDLQQLQGVVYVEIELD
jgi:hypothetical protein